MNIAFAALLAFAAGPVFAQGVGVTGHPEYNIEIIARKDCPAAPSDLSRRALYVQADFAVDRINLAEGPFLILDAIACDLNGAKLQLPAKPYACPTDEETPCDDPAVQRYAVLARPVGKPDAALKLGTCSFAAGPDGLMGTGDDAASCAPEASVEVRVSSRAVVNDASKELMTVSVDADGDGALDRVGLFDPRLRDKLWIMDAEGQAHAQLFFVAVGR